MLQLLPQHSISTCTTLQHWLPFTLWLTEQWCHLHVVSTGLSFSKFLTNSLSALALYSELRQMHFYPCPGKSAKQALYDHHQGITTLSIDHPSLCSCARMWVALTKFMALNNHHFPSAYTATSRSALHVWMVTGQAWISWKHGSTRLVMVPLT